MRAARRPVALVVDDDLGVREALRLLLEQEFDVVDAADGAAGLAVARSCPIQLVLLDLVMPGLHGLEVLARLREIQPCPRTIVITALDTASTAVSAMKLGAFDYVTKPFDPDHLLALARRAVEPAGHVEILIGDEIGAAASLAVLLAVCGGFHVTLALHPGSVPRVDGQGSTVLDMRSLRGIAPAFRTVVQGRRPLGSHAVRVVDYVSRHVTTASVEEVAGAIGVSASHLSQLFRAETTMTVKDYVTRVRIEIAKYLLRDTDDKLDVVAARVGLSDASHLSRIFREREGTRPGAYRHTTG